MNTGEVVGLLGANGAGKSTTFYLAVGLLAADQGQIFLDQKNITNLPLYKRARLGISYLAQESSIFRTLSVEDNIKAIIETLKLPASEAQQRLEDLLDELKIQHIRKSSGYALSGGERRRVEIARALVITPQFILLDEPFAGVDPIVVLDIQNIIRKLSKKGIGILITDHNVRETLGIIDRAYIMNEGNILVQGSPQEVAQNEIARQVYLGQDFVLA